MKSTRSLLFLVPVLIFVFTTNSFALDTDLYMGGWVGIDPNVLIIFDNSTSMDDLVMSEYCLDSYDPNFAYPQPSNRNFDPVKVYKKSGSSWVSYKDSIALVVCVAAQDRLRASGAEGGWYSGSPEYAACNLPSPSITIATGNWLRFNFADAKNKATCKSKLETAKTVIKSFLQNVKGVNIGVMTFNDSFTRADGQLETEGGHILDEIKTLDVSANRTKLINDINALTSGPEGAPLAETLYEAGLYFQGKQGYFNSPPFTASATSYTSPIQYYCQKNYVVIMTDGISTKDRHSILNTIGDQNSDNREPPGAPNDPNFGSEGSDFLDDVAKYLYNTDLRTDMQGIQNISTYTIGFELDTSDPDNAPKAKDLLQRTATQGHGKFYKTNGSGGLVDAFSSGLNEIMEVPSSYVAPIVPVSRLERTSSGDKIYLSFFSPHQTMWDGNIKKYGVQQTNAGSLVVGDVLDSLGSKALNSNGEFYSSSKSYWTTSGPDGGKVQAGGVGEVLKNRNFTLNPRKIYSHLPGCSTGFSQDSCNWFTGTNWSNLKDRLFPPPSTATEAQTKSLINFIRGTGVYENSGDGDNASVSRDWPLGSFLHSRPYVISYKDRTVLYAGSNDGMLHAFDDATGEELWGYIPPGLLGRLIELTADYPGIFVDGSPKGYVRYKSDGVTVDQAILIFGLRRGGNSYTALDVTDPLNPQFVWSMDPTTSGYGELGQTWSSPVIGKIKNGTTDQWVAFIGGGYDVNEDQVNPPANTQGRAVYVVDVLTGSLVKRFSSADMTYCIPGDIAALDVNGDGYIDRLYVGDTNARMWRFDIGDLNKDGSWDPNEWTGRIIFKSNPGNSEKRKIFYPPDVTFEKQDGAIYEMLYFGTGDREAPKNTRDTDRLYAVKDKGLLSPLGESDLVDVTLDLLQDPGTLEGTKSTIRANLNAKSGWYLKLGDKHSGEKCLASPLVFNKVAYYTTFSPIIPTGGDPCLPGEGIATLYAVNYMTGEAAFHLDITSENINAEHNNNNGPQTALTKSDRAAEIGTAIPSGVVVSVIAGQITGYIGVGGGVQRTTLEGRSLLPTTWKLVF
jgi:type IV pilus assembly protein PilY1